MTTQTLKINEILSDQSTLELIAEEYTELAWQLADNRKNRKMKRLLERSARKLHEIMNDSEALAGFQMREAA